jgi:hypothetical protein
MRLTFEIEAVTPGDFRRRSRSPAIMLLRGLQLILAVPAMAWAVPPTAVQATPLNYVFSEASTTLNGRPETITGLFGIDPAVSIQSAFIILTGPPPYAGTYIARNIGLFVPNTILAFNFTDQLAISFVNELSFGDNALARVDLTGPNVNPSVADDTPTGFAVGPPAPVPIPEPTSIALLSTALVLFLFKLRTIRTLTNRDTGC